MENTAQINRMEYEISEMADLIKSLRAAKSHRRRWINEAKKQIENVNALYFNDTHAASTIASATESITNNEAAITEINTDVVRWTGRINELLAAIESAKAAQR